ncbi:MAG: heat-shock protein Hsp20 [Ignavibacteriales bacterium CG18_big_fil_WC_8_21_14_2_50_31_20]|nr:MAG: heat-shock protein Hsp20 [Ignavibacteriales bacterium CG18_big_fil_WC_8_21_14_2_50_31_20]
MTLTRWNPAKELISVEKEFSKLFDSFNNRFGLKSSKEDEDFANAVWSPLTDIREDEDKYSLHLDLPGVKKEDVKITFNNGQIAISGERNFGKEEKNSKYHHVERAFGKYYRAFNLPEKIIEDRIDAEFKDGILKITIPKAEEAKPKQIEVKIK